MLKIYQTWAAYSAASLSETESTVSLITENNAVMYHGVNVVKKFPKVGDFFVVINGKKRFVDAESVTAELINELPVVGKVYDVQGRFFRFVGGVNDQAKKWSDVCDFSIVPDASLFDGEPHLLKVTLQGTQLEDFRFQYSGDSDPDVQLSIFISDLNSYLSNYATNWEAYVNDEGEGILQLSTYAAYESSNSITSCTLTKLVGSELLAETEDVMRNQNGQIFNYYQVMCYDRALAYFATSGSTPAEAPTDIVANTAPVTRAYFEENELGANLRAKFGTYENYIAKCMAYLRELNVGIMQYRDGKDMTEKLVAKTILKNGVEECPYLAADYAHTFAAMFDGAAIEGYGAGKWWLPSMYELGLLMRGLKTDYSDPVNKNMNLVSGWSRINPASSRWSVCRSSASYAWSYRYYGLAYNTSFYNSFAVAVVSASSIEDADIED